VACCRGLNSKHECVRKAVDALLLQDQALEQLLPLVNLLLHAEPIRRPAAAGAACRWNGASQDEKRNGDAYLAAAGCHRGNITTKASTVASSLLENK